MRMWKLERPVVKMQYWFVGHSTWTCRGIVRSESRSHLSESGLLSKVPITDFPFVSISPPTASKSSRCTLLILDDGVRRSVELGGSLEEFELDDEQVLEDLATALGDELSGSKGGSTWHT